LAEDVPVHIKVPLDAPARRALIDHLRERLGVGAEARASGQPHLLFLPTDALRAPPPAVPREVRAQGHEARLGDL
jgi:hypothetical protein